MDAQFLKWIPAFTGMTISTMSSLRKQGSRMKVERNISRSSKIMHLTQPLNGGAFVDHFPRESYPLEIPLSEKRFTTPS